MKSILLLSLLFAATCINAQVPSDFIMKYSFTNGSLQNEDATTTGDFTQTGTTLTTIANRAGAIDNALQINQDYLETTQLTNETSNIAEMTISFWINPSNTATSTEREILRMRSAFAGREFKIQENKSQNELKFSASGRNTSTNAILSCNFDITDASLFDNNWHHIIYRGYMFNSQNLVFQVYIDGVLKSNTASFGCGLNNFNNGTPPQFLLRPSLSISSLASIKYTNKIDDIYFYKRALTASEISALFNQTALGTTEFGAENGQTSIHPNPITSILNIVSNQKIKTVKIYSILGKEVLKTDTININVSSLAKGIYVLKIISSNNTQIVKRFIKQ